MNVGICKIRLCIGVQNGGEVSWFTQSCRCRLLLRICILSSTRSSKNRIDHARREHNLAAALGLLLSPAVPIKTYTVVASLTLPLAIQA